MKFHSGWFRTWSRSNLDTVTTSLYLCMLTHFLYASSYYHLLFWVHSRCPWLSSLYPDFIFILKPSHVPASMPMLYSLPFRRLALTLLISRCRKHLIIIHITDGIRILTPSPKPDQGVDAVRGHCAPRFRVTINLHPTLMVMPNTKPLHRVCMVKKIIIRG